jgi:glycosyltransferase involved in cell wall biosynthesis
MKVLVVAEYYPRRADPVRGIWAHRQTLATARAGAEVRVLVLHRPLPPLASLRGNDPRAIIRAIRPQKAEEQDGIDVEFLNYLSPPRPWSYGSWGAWAAPQLAVRLRTIYRRFRFELIHAHYAVPAGDAVRRALPGVPLIISVHGHDVYGQLAQHPNVRRGLAHARLVLANTAGTARRSQDLGAREVRVVHLGTDIPNEVHPSPPRPTLLTVAYLIKRKRVDVVIAALALLSDRLPDLRYVVVGDGPERARLHDQALALGVADRVEFRGQLPPDAALAAAHEASLFVMPSVDEAFGVAYAEAMAMGVPAIGALGEDGPAELAAAGGGIVLVPPGDVQALAREIETLLGDPGRLGALERAARQTVERQFTWKRCGEQTLEAYQDVGAGTHRPT